MSSAAQHHHHRRRARPPSLVSTLRKLFWCLAIPIGVLSGYLLLAVPLVAIISDPVTATLAVGGIVVVLVGALRAVRPRWVAYEPAPVSTGGTKVAGAFWGLAALAVVLAFLAGQSLAVLLYAQIGSQSYDTHVESQRTSPLVLVLALTLVVAPLSEEALLRGLMFPLLRRKIGVVVSMLVTTTAFALMHGNLIQVVVTVPLGLVLSVVAERTRQLWQCVVLHAGFNLLALFVPAKGIAALVGPTTTLLVAAWGVCLWLLLDRTRARGDGSATDRVPLG